MVSIELEDETALVLNKLAISEHLQPEQLIKKLLDSYAAASKNSELLIDIVNELPDLPSFKNDPLAIQNALRNEWN
jgi:hypothetical protein